jgi:hypothetical protein
MAAINFPDSPSNGDTHVVGGVTYTYDSTETKWKTTINSNAFLPLTGGTLSGNLTLGSNQLTAGGLTYPTSDGTTGQYLQTDGAGALSFQTVSASNLTRMTYVATTSGSSFDVTSIPSGVRRITIAFNRISLSGTDRPLVQLGDSGGIETSGYLSGNSWDGGPYDALRESTSGLIFGMESGSYEFIGSMILHNVTGNTWISHQVGYSGQYYTQHGAGVKTLSGELTQLRLTVTGSNTFDQGGFTVFYED